MKIERIEVYDFMVVFTQKEFNDMISLQPNPAKSAEELLQVVIKAGLAALERNQKSKET